MEKHTNRQKCKWANGWTNRHKVKRTERWVDREAYRKANAQRDGQTEKTDR